MNDSGLIYIQSKQGCNRLEKEYQIWPCYRYVGNNVAIPYNFYGGAFSSWIVTKEENSTGLDCSKIFMISWLHIHAVGTAC